jgi:hypothetical protein
MTAFRSYNFMPGCSDCPFRTLQIKTEIIELPARPKRVLWRKAEAGL